MIALIMAFVVKEKAKIGLDVSSFTLTVMFALICQVLLSVLNYVN